MVGVCQFSSIFPVGKSAAGGPTRLLGVLSALPVKVLCFTVGIEADKLIKSDTVAQVR